MTKEEMRRLLRYVQAVERSRNVRREPIPERQ